VVVVAEIGVPTICCDLQTPLKTWVLQGEFVGL